jgi:TonB family protein
MSAPGSTKQQSNFPPQSSREYEVRLSWELPGRLASFKENLDAFFRRKDDVFVPKRLPGIFWKDVFVDQRLNWKSIGRSYAGHILFAGLVYLISMPFYQERLEVIENFRHDRLVYIDPEQDVLVSEPQKTEPLPRQLAPVISRSSRASAATPADARKRVIEAMAIPKWADNSEHTIVAPSAPKILASAPVPDIVLSSTVPQAPPIAAAASPKLVAPVPDVVPIAPPPDMTQAKASMPVLPQASAIAPPVDTSGARNLASINIAPAPQVVNAEPKLTISTSHVLPNMGNVEPVAPAPDLKSVSSAQLPSSLPTMAQPVAPPPDVKNVANAAGISGKLPASAEPAAPPPDLSGAGTAAQASGALISLNLNPIAGPPRLPDGSRRGAFVGQPEAKATATGTPARQAGSNGPGGDSPVPTKDELGIVAAAVPHSVVNTSPTTMQALSGTLPGQGNSLLAMARPSRLTLPPPKVAVVTETNALDQRVFRGRKYYTMALNKPNLTSAGGSWIFRFAERNSTAKAGEVTAPIPLREVDPAYPADMIHDNIQGVVILYAVIRADGSVAEVKVLEGFDDRLDENARIALSSWMFVPGTRDGNPVDLEAVVRIPFRSKRTY